MKIIMTSQQAREKELKEAAALNEMKTCPECGYIVYALRTPEIIKRNNKTVFRRKCSSCGCIWESDEF